RELQYAIRALLGALSLLIFLGRPLLPEHAIYLLGALAASIAIYLLVTEVRIYRLQMRALGLLK
ncbi:MAG: hypothetical protein QXS67_01665, partial [Candidatus Nezhaarchaeales archaeon]